ncbi:MAG: hypothetical protein AAF149_24870, partial [Bacteroidota bacterium]
CHFDSFSCVHTRTKFKLGQSLLIAKHPQLSEIKLFNHLLKKARKTGDLRFFSANLHLGKSW